jgi:hypothetical protein
MKKHKPLLVFVYSNNANTLSKVVKTFCKAKNCNNVCGEKGIEIFNPCFNNKQGYRVVLQMVL